MKKKEIKNGGTAYGPSINLINKGTSIEGQIKSDGDIRIDGTMQGTISSKSKVVVGISGAVNGNVKCKSADILGKVEGTLEINDTLFLKSTAHIEGDIIASKLVIESGAVFNGKCNMGTQSNTKTEPRIEVVNKKEAAG